VVGFLLDDVVDNFLQECVRLSQLKHPNVMEVIGVCVDGRAVPFLVMPFMNNGNLLLYLKSNRKKFMVSSNKHLDELVTR